MSLRSIAAQGLQPGRSALETATQGFIGDHRCVLPLRVAAQGFLGGLTPRQIALQGLGTCIVVPAAPAPRVEGGARARRRRRDTDNDVILFLLR